MTIRKLDGERQARVWRSQIESSSFSFYCPKANSWGTLRHSREKRIVKSNCHPPTAKDRQIVATTVFLGWNASLCNVLWPANTISLISARSAWHNKLHSFVYLFPSPTEIWTGRSRRGLLVTAFETAKFGIIRPWQLETTTVSDLCVHSQPLMQFIRKTGTFALALQFDRLERRSVTMMNWRNLIG